LSFSSFSISFFSRNEKNADLERKIEKAFGWINTLDFFKTFDSSFDVGYLRYVNSVYKVF
jgi:hypothetical protein